MKTITKLLILMAAITLLTALLAVSAFAEIITGNCGAEGDNVTYRLDTETGLLEISGVGKMGECYWENDTPWFSKSSYIRKVVILEGVTSVANYAFKNCVNISDVFIGHDVEIIEVGAFYECYGLKNVVFQNGLKDIGERAFYYCKRLVDVTLPNSLVTINDEAFAYCLSLTNVVMPNKVKKISSGAFIGTGLTTVIIPGSVDSIGMYSFQQSGLNSVTICEGVKAIEPIAFSQCYGLDKVTIPQSVTSIGAEAFYDCKNLVSIVIKTKNANIDSRAFDFCDSLETICLYKNSTADAFFSSDEYTKVYIDEFPNADFMTFEGYQVREEGYNGLRSLFKVDFNAMPTLEHDGFEVIELGAIFVSADKLAAMGDEFVVSKGGDGIYKTVSYGMTIPVIKNGTLVGNYVSKTEDELVFACTITNFDDTNYNKLVSSRGYAVFADADGNEYVVYCDYEVEEYRSVSLEMICDALYSEGQITADNISYQNVVAFRKED